LKIEESPFVNRQMELSLFQQIGQDIAQGRGEDLLFIAPWGSGKTALLKRIKEILFWDQKNLLPVYFSFSRDYIDLFDFIEDYLVKVIGQILLFDQKERIAHRGSVPNRFDQLQQEAERQGKNGIGEIIISHQRATRNREACNGLLNALTAPKRIAQATNRPIWVMVDHMQHLENLRLADKNITGLWAEGLKTPWAPHLFAGEPPGYLSKYLLPTFGTRIPSVLELSAMPLGEGKALTETLAKFFQVRLAEDLGANWFAYLEQNPGFFTVFLKEARQQNSGVESHQRFVDIYLKSLWQGELGRILEIRLFRAADSFRRAGLLKVLNLLSESGNTPLSFEELQQRLPLSPEEIYPLVQVLERAGLVWERFGSLGLEKHQVLLDWAEVLIRKHLRQEKPAEAMGAMEATIEKRLSEGLEKEASPPAFDGKGLQFSLVLPVDAEVELVAVRALEQIATFTDLDTADIEKAKLALIEACINAGEHSQSFEKKIRVYFSALPETLEILVEDRGKAFDPVEVQARMVRAGDPLSQKRGRGLSLIKEMMDDVRLEKTEIGTRLYMIKKKIPLGKFRDHEKF
jgi:serine/threonine-protein kinase RsbW